MNVIYHLDNTSMPYNPFCSSSFDFWPCFFNPNAPFNRLIRNTGPRSTQVFTDKLFIFNKNWHTTFTWPMKNKIYPLLQGLWSQNFWVVAYDKANSPMISNDPLTPWSLGVTWQIKCLIFPIPQSLWPRNLTGQWRQELTQVATWPSDHVVMRSHVTN